MKENFIALHSIMIAYSIFTGLIGLLFFVNDSYYNEEAQKSTNVEQTKKKFGVGEHIIILPIPENMDITKKKYQFENYPGYEVVGISMTSYGKNYGKYGGGVIVYSNVEEVECTSSYTSDDENNIFSEFGTPLSSINDDLYKKESNEFNEGEHILTIPIKNDIRDKQTQIENHEGYEIVGIATGGYGKLANNFYGGALLYKNTVPVKCHHEEDGYTSFGTPIEKAKSKILEQ